MIKKVFPIFIIFLSFIFIGTTLSFTKPSTKLNFKCLVQLTNYTGEGAYVVVSLVDSKGKYIKTLQVHGKEKRWWDDLTSWYKHLTTSKENVDAVSGASITAGDRKVFNLSLEDTYFNTNYKLRFETAVENQDYKEKDAEVDLVDSNIGKNVNGIKYVRYVKLIKSSV
jgi:hypothetical protein